jgi:hypothetical protein
MPQPAEILYNEDGPVVLTRAGSAAEALELAAEEAAGQDMAVTGTETGIAVGWIRALPCRAGGHEISDGTGWCDGHMRCHYSWGRPGPGAFRGAFVNVRYLGADETRSPE